MRGVHSTGGLRPPLLVAPTCVVADARLCFATAFRLPRGAYAPPLLVAPTRVVADARLCFATAFSFATGGLRPRSWLHPRVSSRMRGCALQRRFVCHGGLTPPAPGCTHACRRGCAVVLCNGVSFATGGLRPPLLCCGANVCRRKSEFCDARTHIRSRAAGVSPPWFVNGVCNCNATNFRVSRSHARSAPHGGLTPPALVLRCERLPKKNDFCDARSHVHKSGGRQPAVVR
jgi:hypothetical protein